MATFGSAYFTYLFFESGSNEGLWTGRTSIVEKREIGPTFTAGEFIVNLVNSIKTVSSEQELFRS